MHVNEPPRAVGFSVEHCSHWRPPSVLQPRGLGQLPPPQQPQPTSSSWHGWVECFSPGWGPWDWPAASQRDVMKVGWSRRGDSVAATPTWPELVPILRARLATPSLPLPCHPPSQALCSSEAIVSPPLPLLLVIPRNGGNTALSLLVLITTLLRESQWANVFSWD